MVGVGMGGVDERVVLLEERWVLRLYGLGRGCEKRVEWMQ